jgi:plasmid stabilization system protein ParE
MRVRWTRRATKQLGDLRSWLSTIDGANLQRVNSRIKASGQMLEFLGDIGRPSHFGETREISVRGAPYVLVYIAKRDHFLIVAVFHTAQDR